MLIIWKIQSCTTSGSLERRIMLDGLTLRPSFFGNGKQTYLKKEAAVPAATSTHKHCITRKKYAYKGENSAITKLLSSPVMRNGQDTILHALLSAQYSTVRWWVIGCAFSISPGDFWLVERQKRQNENLNDPRSRKRGGNLFLTNNWSRLKFDSADLVGGLKIL